ncbi:MAG: prealbumin-like fold domain-containing protein [Clostridiales bacterium]|nr:prealbumin-like fold domain-containing protein [Clostridiales bacterium]
MTQTLLQYTTPTSQQVTIINDSSVDATVSATQNNILKKWRIAVHKKDAILLEEGASQYKASLAGAVYGLYDGETDGEANLIATYETDEKGYFQTDYYICGDNWYLQEISPSLGYLLDETKYPIKASFDEFPEGKEYNEAVFDSTTQKGKNTNCVYEEPVLGKINIKKTDEDGNNLEGVEFSLKDADGKVVDTVTTDVSGSAVFEDVIPATYTITETKTQKGFSLLTDTIEVDIPYRMSEDDAASHDNIVLDDALYNEEEGDYLFYTLTYTIKDSATLNLPITGNSGMSIGWIAAGCLLLMLGVSVFLKKKRQI